MVTTQRILIVEPDEREAARFSQLVASHGCAARSVRSGSEAVAGLGAEGAELVVIGERLAAAEQGAVAKAAAQHDAALLLGVTGEPLASHYETALQLGCAAVLRHDADAAAVQRALGSARARRHAATLTREEVRRHKYQSEELRKRCTQQAERFQETQETFFLDLSRMMTIITNIMDGIVFVDRAGNVTLLNPVAEDLLGAKSFVAIGKPMAVMQGRTELVTALTADHARLQGQKEVSQTVEVHHNEQDLLYIKCITSRVFDYRGHPAGTLSVLKDVTAEFKTDQLKNQYLSIVAHELRTPLTGIKTFSTMMAKGSLGPLSDRQQRVCESIREQSLRLEHQIDKLINLGNLESADYGRDREVIPVREFAAGLLLPFEQSTRDRHIKVTLQDESTEQNLFADRADLRRACQALVENAIKFTPDGGSVEIRITVTPDDGLRFGVRDNGIGIDPRYHRRIFEKFFQVEDPLTRHHGGAGLGLFVARGIVEAHGSRIEISSQLGQGADFSFILPTCRPTIASEKTAEVPA